MPVPATQPPTGPPDPRRRRRRWRPPSPPYPPPARPTAANPPASLLAGGPAVPARLRPDPVHRDRERVRTPPDLAMDTSQLRHVRIRDRTSDTGQPDYRRAGRPDDCPVGGAHRAQPESRREVRSDSETVASITN